MFSGRSRNLIISELRRTNLDVNLAVNNLLSRNEEDGDDGDEGMFLLDLICEKLYIFAVNLKKC